MENSDHSLQEAPKLRFAIFWAGALIRDRNLSYIYKEKMTLPSVHIIGDKDYVKEVPHTSCINNICLYMSLRSRQPLQVHSKVFSSTSLRPAFASALSLSPAKQMLCHAVV